MKKLFTICLLAAGVMTGFAKDIQEFVVTTTPQMSCSNCENKIKGNLRFEKGVKNIQTDLEHQCVIVTYDADQTNETKLTEAFGKINYTVSKTAKPGETLPAETTSCNQTATCNQAPTCNEAAACTKATPCQAPQTCSEQAAACQAAQTCPEQAAACQQSKSCPEQAAACQAAQTCSEQAAACPADSTACTKKASSSCKATAVNKTHLKKVTFDAKKAKPTESQKKKTN